MAKTADRLLEGVKRRVVLPASTPLMQDADLLAFADDVTASYLVPCLMSVNQEFFVYKTLTDVVVGQAEYRIPYRSIGRTLRDLKLTLNGSVRDLVNIYLEDAHLYRTGEVVGFYFRGDRYVLVPTPQSTGQQVEEWYNLAPSALVELDNAAVVTSFTATTVTVSSVPGTITTGTLVDFIQGKSGAPLLKMDATVTNVASTTLTFDPDVIPTDLAVGDYLSLAQTTPVIMLPDEAYPLLETATSIRVLNAIGDFEGAGRLAEDKAREEKDLKLMIAPRNEGENQVVINRRGLLRGRTTVYRRGFR